MADFETIQACVRVFLADRYVRDIGVAGPFAEAGDEGLHLFLLSLGEEFDVPVIEVADPA